MKILSNELITLILAERLSGCLCLRVSLFAFRLRKWQWHFQQCSVESLAVINQSDELGITWSLSTDKVSVVLISILLLPE